MKPPRSLGDLEYIYRSTNSGEALGQFFFTNMGPEVEKAIDDRVITPTVTEFIQLAGIDLDGLPPLTLAELIGPTRVGDLDSRTQAFYFSGPMHPILVKARKLDTFVTYADMLCVHENMGIRQAEVTKNFRGLLEALYEDEAVRTFGEPWEFRDSDAGGEPFLGRFAIRRAMAQRAMRGDYKVGISGAPRVLSFNGYGRALVRAIYDGNEAMRRMELTMDLESMDDLLPDKEDANCFDWRRTYTNSEGLGFKLSVHGYDGPILDYIFSLLKEIGAVDNRWNNTISENGFVAAVTALCPLDNHHRKTIKSGHICSQGVHYKGLTTKSVQRAKSIAACITETEGEVERDPAERNEVEINLSDPGLQTSRTVVGSV